MNAIQLMVHEHTYIKRMLAVIRAYCYRILKNQPVDLADFEELIDFVRSYADKHHHGKEEELLFNKMMAELGPVAEKLVKHGMLVEHDLGRLHMMELEAALKKLAAGDEEAKLDVIANAISYTHLLTRHIDKEDKVAYPFAEKNLAKETIEKLDQECVLFENDAEAIGVQKKYIAMVEKYEAKLKAM